MNGFTDGSGDGWFTEEKDGTFTPVVLSVGYSPAPTSGTDADAIQRLMRAARQAADVDLGDSDREIEALRDALSIALGRWPEVTSEDTE